MTRAPLTRLLLAALAIAAAGGVAYWLTRPDPGEPSLRAFVFAKPPVPVVFTSRSEATSLDAAAPEGEGFVEPGVGLWRAREGRLRLLTPRGTVHELTWGKPLPDGGTLIDVMSPSVSLDGRRILFAGRKGGDRGRFRLYEVGIDGSGLRALTGGPSDEGCVALPPMRKRADGTMIGDAERRAVDYDDVDPIELNFTDRRVLFVSSRTPDLGRDHARRSTTLWLLHADGRKRPVTGNRNNDRWPFLLRSRYVAFSLWSRNREVVTAGRDDVRPFDPKEPGATAPTDAWLGAFTQLPGGHFGMLVKPPVPVWRPRPLFSGRITFMTTFAERRDEPPRLTVAQAAPGLVAGAPSARSPADPLPRAGDTQMRRGPDRDADGQPLWLATPGPCPPSHVLLCGAAVREGEASPRPGDYGLYLTPDDWPGDGPSGAASVELTRLFDDPDFVDAEPVAVYVRKIPLHTPEAATGAAPPPDELPLANGRVYRGPTGLVMATALDSPTLMQNLPGQQTDAGQGPIFDAPPAGAIDRLRIYAARRDRFDDPERPRVLGEWERILEVPVKGGTAGFRVPADVPTVLAGYDKAGRVVRWTTAAKDREGRQVTLHAYAGDHYSLAQPNGKHFCVGCHPGHSGLSLDHHDHAERVD